MMTNHRRKNSLFAAIAILMAASSLMLSTSRFAHAGASFTVDNTTSNPVPVSGSVNVSNLPAVQEVAGTVEVSGSVNVSNLPAVQEVAGTVQVARPELVHGHGMVSLSTVWNQRFLSVPADAVITDVRIERIAFPGDADPCEIWLGEIVSGTFDAATFFRPSAAQPFVEFHLESGFGANPGTTDRGFFMNSDCTAHVFWAGYITSP